MPLGKGHCEGSLGDSQAPGPLVATASRVRTQGPACRSPEVRPRVTGPLLGWMAGRFLLVWWGCVLFYLLMKLMCYLGMESFPL